jgi:hypothetical protein
VRQGPVKLQPVDLESGCVADNTTWKSGLTTITPAKEFKGAIAKSSWLLNKDIAFIYRAYATHDWPLKITSPSNMSAKDEVFGAGSSVTIKVDDSKFIGWTKLDLYDGAKKVGELTKGPAKFTVKDLTAGYHTFSVLGTDGKDNIRPSNPVPASPNSSSVHGVIRIPGRLRVGGGRSNRQAFSRHADGFQ